MALEISLIFDTISDAIFLESRKKTLSFKNYIFYHTYILKKYFTLQSLSISIKISFNGHILKMRFCEFD